MRPSYSIVAYLLQADSLKLKYRPWRMFADDQMDLKIVYKVSTNVERMDATLIANSWRH